MEIIYVIIGLVIGLVSGWFIQRNLSLKSIAGERQKTSELDKRNSAINERLNMMEEEKSKLDEEIAHERHNNTALNARLAGKDADYKNLEEKLEEQKKEIEEIQKKFTLEFENIATRILKQHSQEFTESNQKNIGQILNPLKEKIGQFEKKVQETYIDGLKDRTELKTELKKLMELNQQISEEAGNLTRALKSDTKKMGNWGEMILERILEQSGLVKGQEYETQYTDRNEAGEIIRPDVIIHLPEKKHIIIDSKVSLLAYDSYVNAEEDNAREGFRKAHIDSIREHVRGLSEKKYQEAVTLDVPDFILLFMPLESAFSLAIQKDPGLFNFAWQRKIVIVSPTTLLATLKTVEAIWEHEKQTQNAMEIARHGGRLYDKFYNFLTDLENIGKHIDNLQTTYTNAHKKLTDGRGNLIRQVEKLKQLGVKTEKSLTDKYLTDEGQTEK